MTTIVSFKTGRKVCMKADQAILNAADKTVDIYRDTNVHIPISFSLENVSYIIVDGTYIWSDVCEDVWEEKYESV